MASAIPTPNHIIIWLDQHIGLVQWNEELKSTVGGQADPNNETPTAPTDGNIGTFIKFRDNMNQSFYEIPDNLKAFSRKKECLECIEDSLKKEKKIFFITSGSLGKTIAPEIINKYKSLKTIYVFCDLLERLLRDVAEYFISEGDTELNRSKQLAYSANIYFGWAKLLLERANKFATRQIFDRLKYVEERIEFTEQLLAQSNGNVDEKMSDESHR